MKLEANLIAVLALDLFQIGIQSTARRALIVAIFLDDYGRSHLHIRFSNRSRCFWCRLIPGLEIAGNLISFLGLKGRIRTGAGRVLSSHQ